MTKRKENAKQDEINTEFRRIKFREKIRRVLAKTGDVSVAAKKLKMSKVTLMAYIKRLEIHENKRR